MTNDAKRDEEIAALNRRIEELERKAKPPEPLKEDPNWRRYDPTAGMTMPLSTLREMCNAVPDSVMRGVIRDNRAPTSPGTIPRTEGPSNARQSNVAGSGTGWAHERPLGPQPGIGLIDRGVNAALPHGPGWGKEKKE